MLDVNFQYISPFNVNSDSLEEWIREVLNTHSKQLGEICVVFCSDNYLLDLNKESLNHDYFTDIITFDYTVGEMVSGDLFISIDRVKDNALSESVDWKFELGRVLIHGCLHMCGFGDKSEEDAKEMRRQENEALKHFNIECFT